MSATYSWPESIRDDGPGFVCDEQYPQGRWFTAWGIEDVDFYEFGHRADSSSDSYPEIVARCYAAGILREGI